MDKRDRPDDRHTHPCGHDCECKVPTHDVCDGCELASVVIRRHELGEMSPGEALARLELAMQISAGEGTVRLNGPVVDDMIDLERGVAPWSR